MTPTILEPLHPDHAARFGSARDGVCVLGPDWKIRYANASLLEILRLLGGGDGVSTFWDAMPGWEGTPEAELLRAAMEEREPVRFQLDPGRYEGRLWEVEAEPLLSGELRVRLHNATHRIQRDAAVRDAAEQARRLSAAALQAPVGLALIEAGSWTLLEANPAALSLFSARRRTAETALARSLAELIPGWAALEGRVARVATTGEPWDAPEYEHRSSSGGLRWFRVSVRRLDPATQPAHLLATLVEVTQEVRARRAAEAERRVLFGILDALPVGVMVGLPPGGEVDYLNRAALEIVGRGEAGPLLLRPDGETLPPDRTPLIRALGGETLREEELRVLHASGAERVVVASASPVAASDGRVERAVAVLHDITERQRMEHALLASRRDSESAAAEAALRAEESRALREIGRALVSQPDPERVLYMAAHAAAELLPARGAFVATPAGAKRVLFSPATGVLASLDGRVIPLAESAFARLEEREGTRVFNSLDELPAEGALRPRLERLGVDRFAFAPMEAFGERVGTLGVVDREGIFTAEDARVLEALADSAALALHNARLLAAERRRAEESQALLNAAEAAISTLDAGEVMRRIVAIAQRLTGADGAGITLVEGEGRGRLRMPVAVGRLESWLGMGGPAAGTITERVLGEGRAQTLVPEDLPVDSPARRALEALGAACYTLAPMRGGGEPVGALGVVHDRGGSPPSPGELPLLQSLADQAALALRNARLYEQAQAASRAKSQFLATMSHELRTPINALEGYAALLEDGVFGPVNEAQAHALGRMRASQRHLLALIEQVLDAARLEAGARQPQPADLDGAELVLGVVESLRATAERKGLSLALDSPGPVPLRTDAGLVRQILNNLVGNALKFTERGGVAVRVRTAASGFQVAVEDSGPGIAAEHLEHIWEPFYQVEPGMTRREGGTGLGLALCREYARLLGGEITVQSQPGEGCVFVLALPSLATPA